MNACFNQSTTSSEVMTMTTGVISVLSDVDAGSLNKGTKVEGKMEEGPDSDSSMILRSVITNRNADC